MWHAHKIDSSVLFFTQTPIKIYPQYSEELTNTPYIDICLWKSQTLIFTYLLLIRINGDTIDSSSWLNVYNRKEEQICGFPTSIGFK